MDEITSLKVTLDSMRSRILFLEEEYLKSFLPSGKDSTFFRDPVLNS